MVVAVPKMRERDRVGLPTCLPAQLLEHKGFQQLAKQRAILVQRGRVQPQQRRCHACVGQMHLRCLDQSAWLAQVPRRQLFQQKDAFRQRDVVPDDGPADPERVGQIAHIEQACRLGCCELQQPRQCMQGADARHVHAQAVVLRQLEAGTEQLIYKATGTAFDFALRQRLQPLRLGARGQGIGQASGAAPPLP